MALLKLKKNSRLMSAVLAALVLALLCGCSEKGGPPAVGGGGAAGVYESTPLMGGVSSAYWVVDRIEEGAVGEDGIAVLEDLETLRAEDWSVRDLPVGVREGQVLTDDDGALRVDSEETAVRAARIVERFERLKAN